MYGQSTFVLHEFKELLLPKEFPNQHPTTSLNKIINSIATLFFFQKLLKFSGVRGILLSGTPIC
jgi:hypothetical protein